MAEEKQDVETLKRRGRRRLVGAVALVLAAVIVLPMVFDPEPRRGPPAVGVRIPGENEKPFEPKPVAKKPEPVKKAEEPEKKAEEPPKQAEEPAKKAEAPPKKAAPPPPAEQHVFQVGAYANPQGVIAKLKSAKIPYYTEPAPNNLTRVRAGPFATKEAAEKAVGQVKGLGLQPGNVSTKAG